MTIRPDCSWCPVDAVDLCPAETQHSQTDVRAVPALGPLFSFLPTSGCHIRAIIVSSSVSGSPFHTIILLPPLFHVDFCSSVYWRDVLCQPLSTVALPVTLYVSQSPDAPLLSNKSFSSKSLTLYYIFILLLPHIPYKGVQLTEITVCQPGQ